MINKDMKGGSTHGAIFTLSSVKGIFAIERLSDIQLDNIILLKGKAIQTGGGKSLCYQEYSNLTEKTNLQFHWSTIITSPYDYLFIEKVISISLLIKQPQYGGSRRWTQIPWLATISCNKLQYYIL